MLRKAVAFLSVLTIAFSGIVYSPAVVKAEVSNPGDNVWSLVWSDEFNGNSLDQGVWNYDIGGSDGGGWGNNELQYYTNKGDNVYVNDGSLKLKAKRESYGGCRFTSGRIKTNGKKSFKYGKMEARIRVIGGNQDGVWPAFWMMGDDGQPWPSCGELDIMEHANGRNYVEGTIHWNENGLQSQVGYNHVFWGSYANNSYYWFNDNENNGITAWHTYGVTWDESSIKWYVDGNVYETAYLGANNAYAFQKAHYFLLNLALGSNATPYTGNVAPNDWFSEATMEVDYVRAYSYNPNGGSGSQGGGSDTPSGYTDGNADNNWHNTGSWNYLVGGDARLAYKNSSSQDSYDVYIKSRGTWDWCTQIRPNDISLENGAKYKYEVTVNSSKAFSPLVMNYEDGQDGYKSTLINQGVNAGNTTYTGEFTADSNKARFKMDLFNADAGTTFKVTKFSISKVSSATQAPTDPPTQATTKKPSVDPNSATYEYVPGSDYLKYSVGSDATIVNVQNPGWTEGNYSGDGIYFHVPAGIESIKVNDGAGAHIEGAGGLVYLSALKTGNNKIDVKYAGGETTFYIKKESAPTTTAAPTTVKNIPNGFGEGVENAWTNLGAWNYYFVTGWTGAKGYVKGGSSLNDFAVNIAEQNQTAWGTQIKPNITLKKGKKYNYSFTFNSTSADNIVINEDIEEGVSNTLVSEKLKVGDNSYSGSFTVQKDNESIVISLGELANGGTFTVKNFKVEEVVETTTQAPTTTKAPTTAAPTTTKAETTKAATTAQQTTTKEATTAQHTTKQATTAQQTTKVDAGNVNAENLSYTDYSVNNSTVGYSMVGGVTGIVDPVFDNETTLSMLYSGALGNPTSIKVNGVEQGTGGVVKEILVGALRVDPTKLTSEYSVFDVSFENGEELIFAVKKDMNSQTTKQGDDTTQPASNVENTTADQGPSIDDVDVKTLEYTDLVCSDDSKYSIGYNLFKGVLGIVNPEYTGHGNSFILRFDSSLTAQTITINGTETNAVSANEAGYIVINPYKLTNNAYHTVVATFEDGSQLITVLRKGDPENASSTVTTTHEVISNDPFLGDDFINSKNINSTEKYGHYTIKVDGANYGVLAAQGLDDSNHIKIKNTGATGNYNGTAVVKEFDGLVPNSKYIVKLPVKAEKSGDKIHCAEAGGDITLTGAKQEIECLVVADQDGKATVTIGTGKLGTDNVLELFKATIEVKELVTQKQTTTTEATETTTAKAAETTTVSDVTNATSNPTQAKPIAKVKIKKVVVKKKSAKKLTIKIKKLAGVKGYQVAVYKTKKNASKNKKALFKKFVKKNVATLKITHKKLKNKKTLFVRVRAYNKGASTEYGVWSDVKKVKVK